MLRCSEKEHLPIDSLQQIYEITGKKEGITGVFLQRITDPHNLGAILRSCHYFGVDFVFVDHVNRCPLTSTVSRTSAGALELMEVYSSEDPVKLLTDAKADNWSIKATCSPAELANSQTRDSASRRTDSSPSGGNGSAKKGVILAHQSNTIICFGAEGSGLSSEIRDLATHFEFIEKADSNRAFPASLVDSLNVSVACAVIVSRHMHLDNRN